MSEFRRKLMIQKEEGDIDYVYKQFQESYFIYPASPFYDNSCNHIRGYNGSGSDWARHRVMLVISKNIARIPVKFYGRTDGYYMRPDESEISFIHIPPSINKFSFKHSGPSNYQVECHLFAGLSSPIVKYSSGWKSANANYVFDLSDNNDDLWASFTIHNTSNSVISFTTSEQFKQLFNIEIEVT